MWHGLLAYVLWRWVAKGEDKYGITSQLLGIPELKGHHGAISVRDGPLIRLSLSDGAMGLKSHSSNSINLITFFCTYY